jgi:hypothetical protein
MQLKDKDKWKEAVEEEPHRMKENCVWSAVSKDYLDSQAKILTITWAMKKKASRMYRARINARGFEQVDGIH